MKRLYVCTECGTRQDIECQENIIKPVVAAFCPVCGDVQVFMMLTKVVKGDAEQGGEGCPY
ncbi:MAG: hypothetical protein JRE40_16255 [Deltaproteobacteria bacterium]|nr:hypothetical protein [Deltaproteobacteria bacterium]